MEDLATSEEVAAYLRISPQTLANWASQGKGPKYYKVGGHRRYDWAVVREWVLSRVVGSTD